MTEVTLEMINAVKRAATERQRRGNQYSNIPEFEEDAMREYSECNLLWSAAKVLEIVSDIQHHKGELGI